MPWTVTRQSQWPDGNLIVEISDGGLDYTNPGALSSKYPGEFQTFKSKTEAVQTGIDIARAWQKDEPGKQIHIGTGGTGGMTMPFDPLPLTEGICEQLLEEAAHVDEGLEKCDQCGEILGSERETWRNANSDWSGNKFCSEQCADKAQEHDEETRCRKCHGDNTDGEGEDGLCGNCADKRERKKWREVEVARAWSGGEGDSGTWDTFFYDIPRDTPEDKIEEEALKVAEEAIKTDQTAFDHLQYLWIYSIPDLEEDEESDE